MNTYKTSTGERLTKANIDRRIRQAKQKVIDTQILEHGYHFCEECDVSASTYFDCSHIISVKDCQESGRSELAYDPKNIRILCRNCHRKHDKI